MKVLTYVDGLLTVINGGSFYQEETDKPPEIPGTAFYYEPTLKMVDDIPLTAGQEIAANDFIDAFIFPVADEPEPAIDPEANFTHNVDAYGNYMGFFLNDGDYTEADSAAPSRDHKWTGTEWFVGVVIDNATGRQFTFGGDDHTEDFSFAPDPGETLFDKYLYSWDGFEWVLSLEDAKAEGLRLLILAQNAAVFELTGRVALGEVSSWEIQYREAQAWLADNTTITPFIDLLLAAREEEGETKETLITLIVQKGVYYNNEFAPMLGTFHKKQKAIERATTLEEVYAIKWDNV